jgi:hypothetical protein
MEIIQETSKLCALISCAIYKYDYVIGILLVHISQGKGHFMTSLCEDLISACEMSHGYITFDMITWHLSM